MAKPTSSKPKAFQFIEGRPEELTKPEEAVDDKENTDYGIENTSRQKTRLVPLSDSSGSPKNAFPSTPATRLPLADLIGNIDDINSLNTTAQASPEDHIQWRSVRSPRTADGKCASASQRRPRSSSPPTSSQLRASSQKPRAAIQTPALDPAADLWLRYSTSSAREGGAPVEVASLAKLVGTSSPHSAIEDRVGNVSGLRRWGSCGMEFPNSKAKRRKTKHIMICDRIEETSAYSPIIANAAPVDPEKKLRMGLLLERIQESLTRSLEVPELEVPEQPAPASSSPLPDRSPSLERKSLSPIRSRVSRTSTSNHNPQAQAERNMQLQPQKIDARSTSSFGSADLDDTVFDIAQTATTYTEDTTASRIVEAVMLPNPVKPVPMSGTQPGEGAFEGSTLVNEDDFDDDLDLSDFDVDDFDKIITTHEQTMPDTKEYQTQAAISQAVQAVDEDEFGDDDMDEDCLIQAEVAATQSYQSQLPQKQHVRTWQTYRSIKH